MFTAAIENLLNRNLASSPAARELCAELVGKRFGIVVTGLGVRVVVDPKSLLFLNGTTLDYETKLMGHGFKFVNPNEAAGCGCGTSFGV